MSQATNFGVPLFGPATPAQMAERIDESLRALMSAHSGAGRPDYAVPGTEWVSTATPGFLKYYVYDGTADRLTRTINIATGAIAYGNGASDDALSLLLAKTGGAALDLTVAPASAPTKKLAFDNSAIAVGQTRKLGMPDRDVDLGNMIKLGAPVTLSGTGAIDFTAIPAGVRRVTMHVDQLTLTGTASPIVQLGTSVGVEAAGYRGSCSAFQTTVTTSLLTNSVLLAPTGFWGASSILNGALMFELVDQATNLWSFGGSLGFSHGAGAMLIVGGTKALAGSLDRLRLVQASGTGTFAGKASISWEF